MPVFNPGRPAYLENPYPFLAALRADEPVHWSRDMNAWIVTSYEECFAAVQDQGRFSADPRVSYAGTDVSAHRERVPLGTVEVMATVDEPDHGRLRRSVMRAFAPRAVEAAQERIKAAIAGLLGPVDPGQPFDVFGGLAEPLVVATVIGHLGIPADAWNDFRACARAVTEARSNPGAAAGDIRAAQQAYERLQGLFRGAHEDLDTVLGAAKASVADGMLSEDEAVMLLVHASLSGNGPTTMALGNMILALAGNPEAYAWLRDHPNRVPAAVEELLRYDSPVHAIARWAPQPCQLGRRSVRAGQVVFLVLGAANRDPAQFPDPDVLDLGRDDTRHLAFSHGPHFCLGAPLARLELQLALAAVLDRWPSLTVLAMERLRDFVLRGPRRLVIAAR